MKRITIEVPATSANLGPGFDTLGLALDIADTFTVELDEDSKAVLVDDATCMAAGVPAEDHYVCRAYHAWVEDTGSDLPGARFTLDRRIPLGKGLGSSAASIVAGLAAAAHAAGDKDARDRIIRLSGTLEGHPDNSSAATLGGITAAFCESGEVHALQVVSHMTVGVALFIPDAPLPTVEARAILPEQVPIADAIHNIGHSAYLIAALTWGRLDHIGAAMRDRLHQPYRTRLIPALQDVIAAAVDAGAYGAALSGGGPSVIALGPRNQIDAIASAMESRAHDVDWRGCSIVSQIRARGVQVKEE